MTTTTSKSFHVPADRHYDGVNHIWAQFDPDANRAAIGLDMLGLESLGDLAYVSLQAAGTPVRRGESIGVLEAAKMTTDLIAPVSGVLAERNEDVLRDPTLVNSDCYGAGWLAAIEPSDWAAEAADLVYGDALPAWVEAEAERYRSEGLID